MPWNKNDYPPSMKNLDEKTRNKAIEIANALLDEGYEEGKSIAIATSKAEEWVSKRDVLKEDHKDQHVKYIEDKWKIIREGNERASHTFDTKAEAVEKAKKMAKNQSVQLVIHKKNGDIEDTIIP